MRTRAGEALSHGFIHVLPEVAGPSQVASWLWLPITNERRSSRPRERRGYPRELMFMSHLDMEE